MGKKIDSALLTAALAAGFYLFYMGAFGNIPAAWLLTVLTLFFGKKALQKFPLRRKKSGRKKRLVRAKAFVHAISRMEQAAGEDEVWAILTRAYSCESERGKTEILLKISPLSEDDVLAAWRRRAGEDKFALVTTGEVTKSARYLAAELSNPCVRLIDGSQLSALLAREELPDGSGRARHFVPVREVIARGLDRGRARRNILIGGSMALLFCLNGHGLYLLAGLFLIGLGIASLIRPAPPEEYL